MGDKGGEVVRVSWCYSLRFNRSLSVWQRLTLNGEDSDSLRGIFSFYAIRLAQKRNRHSKSPSLPPPICILLLANRSV